MDDVQIKSKKVSDFLKHEEPVFEEVPEDFDDGWTEDDIIAAAKRIMKRLGINEEQWKSSI